MLTLSIGHTSAYTKGVPTWVILGVCQVGQTPLEAYVGIEQAYLGSFG